jgi:hypothetical protein
MDRINDHREAVGLDRVAFNGNHQDDVYRRALMGLQEEWIASGLSEVGGKDGRPDGKVGNNMGRLLYLDPEQVAEEAASARSANREDADCAVKPGDDALGIVPPSRAAARKAAESAKAKGAAPKTAAAAAEEKAPLKTRKELLREGAALDKRAAELDSERIRGEQEIKARYGEKIKDGWKVLNQGGTEPELRQASDDIGSAVDGREKELQQNRARYEREIEPVGRRKLEVVDEIKAKQFAPEPLPTPAKPEVPPPAPKPEVPPPAPGKPVPLPVPAPDAQSVPDQGKIVRPQAVEPPTKPGAVAKGLGVVGIAAGAYTAHEGLKKIEDGRVAEGAVETGIGTGTIASSAALIGGKAVLSGATGGVVGIADGAYTMYQGYQENNTEKMVTGGVKTAAGATMAAGAAMTATVGGAVVGVPMMVGGAIVYTGTSIYESRHALAAGAKKAWNWVTGV